MGYFISPKFYTIAWICCITFLFGSVAIGETQSRTIKLGVVDLNEITRKSLMSKDIARQIDSKRRTFRDEIKNEEEKLRSDNDELQKQRVLLSPEALQNKYRALQQRQTALQRKVQQRNQEFIRLRSFATREFEKERVKAVMDVTKKHKFTLVIRRREVVVRADFLDITGLVLETLNKRKTKFNIPDDLAKSGK
ncbi:MAG TPA: OmpH family outer membrane protein [Rhodospirillales bacterium]|nr:OmpH family outer membrane protein [Rhodospirillales bacterium]